MIRIGKNSTSLQILFWVILWVVLPFFFYGFPDREREIVRALVISFSLFAVLWVNLEVLLPQFYFKKKTALYILGGVALLALILFLLQWEWMPWADHFDPPDRVKNRLKKGNRRHSVLHNVFVIAPYLTAFIGSALFEIASFANRQQKEAIALRNEKLEAEMKFLKSQINPHFLFNALNNIYTLTVIKSEKAPDNLLKLSGMLRYMLYDCKADRVALGDEIAYIKNFIDLNKLKDSGGMKITVSLDDQHPDWMIAPLLFIPFIENAFKHSKIEDLENGWIDIQLKAEDKKIDFRVSNSLPKEDFSKDAVGGIGLKNIQRQLELLYPNQHQLTIMRGPQQFDIKLKIQLA